ncbi:TonB-dependent receptor [Neptunicella sp.]|uniref:TonB-dependent receptor n=1 Tax=Neptunicella sp. TaxID=2125986 RepID=UPI003F68D227
MISLTKNKKAKLSLLVLSMGLSTHSIAQEEEVESKKPKEHTLETIEVTAERRVENIQKSPLAASVIQGDEISKLGITKVDQLQFAMPSVVVNNFGQGVDFNIRGIGKAEHNTQTTTGVITYRDGVATFPGYYTAEPYYDIARVEVLRGPQGTFAGQNATGGAVFVNSNNPEIGGTYSGYLLGQVGNYRDVATQGALNIPISDTFAARIAFNTENRDSFYDIEGPYTGDDGISMQSGRLSLLWEPSDSLSVLFKSDYNYQDLSAYPTDPVNSPNDMFETTANADLAARDKFSRSVLKIDYTFAGGTILRSVSGYQSGKSLFKADLDGTSVGIRTFRDEVEERIFSQELNLISPDNDGFNWILGAYFQNDDITFPPGQFVTGLPEGNPATEYRLEGENPKETRAVFGQVTLDLSEGLELQVGLRHSRSNTENQIDIVQYGLPLESYQKAEYSKTTGKVSLNWDVNTDHFLYAFAATGYRPGGLNVNVGLGLPEPFDQEEVTSYEFGWKASWLDDHLRTQLTGFHNDYDNFQVRIGYPDIPTFAFQLNTPETTKITGMEAQLQGVFGDFSINAGMSIMRSKLGEFYATDPRVPAPGTTCDPISGPETISCIALEGRDQTYAPDVTFNFSMQYEFMLDKGTLTPRLNFGHVSEQWATLFQNEALGDRIESRNIMGGQVAWQYQDWTVTLYATNLTDRRYVSAINSGLRLAGLPRQYGLRVMKTFF